MLQNIPRVAKKKFKEMRPRKRNLKAFGSGSVGVRKSTVDAYEY